MKTTQQVNNEWADLARSSIKKLKNHENGYPHTNFVSAGNCRHTDHIILRTGHGRARPGQIGL